MTYANRPRGKFAPAMTVYATPDQRARLARLNAVTKVPQSEIVRDGIAMAIEAWERRHVAGGGTLPPLEEPQGATTTAAE